jgi:hypothetical protein
MLNIQTQNLWHPAENARLYESAGSRSSFNNSWNKYEVHHAQAPSRQPESPDWLRETLAVLRDEEKARWLGAITELGTK